MIDPGTPSLTVGLLARFSPAALERTLGAIASQLTRADELLVVPLAGLTEPDETAVRVEESRIVGGVSKRIALLSGSGPGVVLDRSAAVVPASSPAVAFNAVLAAASGEVVAFLDDGVVPVPGWLESLRFAFRNPGTDAVAGALDRQPDPYEKTRRPGGRLRWTGHLAGDFTALRGGVTSLVPPVNFALRRARVLEAGGFDTGFTAAWPLVEVELLVRLGKGGSRFRYLPSARAVSSRPERALHARSGSTAGDSGTDSGFDRSAIDESAGGHTDDEPAGGPAAELEQRIAVLRSLAAVFARHESWAVPIMFASQLLQAVIEVAARRLPPEAPGHLSAAIREGLRLGGRPAAGTSAGMADRTGKENG